MEDRPIVFTISENNDNTYSIVSKDSRARWGDGGRIGFLHSVDVFSNMVYISEELNNRGYAVLFEVD